MIGWLFCLFFSILAHSAFLTDDIEYVWVFSEVVIDGGEEFDA